MNDMEKRNYHRQNEENWCGPASIQMVLNYLADRNIPLSTFPSLQGDALQTGRIQSHNVPWDWPKYGKYFFLPDEIAQALAKLAKSSQYQAVIKPTITKEYNNDKKAWEWKSADPPSYKSSLENYLLNLGKYPIVAVHSKLEYSIEVTIPPAYQNLVTQKTTDPYEGHWIVLSECQTGNSKNGFLGFDPWLPQLSGIPPAITNHSLKDDNCQEVILHISGELEIFQKNFPKQSRVAIVWKLDNEFFKTDPDPQIDNTPPLPPPRSCRNLPFDTAMERSLFSQMTEFGLRTQPPCNSYLSQATLALPGVRPQFRIGKPRLVRRLDGFCDDYYLIPLLKTSGDSNVLVRVDAPTGKYLDSLYYSENPLLIDETPAQQHLVNSVIPVYLTKIGRKSWIIPFQEQIKNKKNPPEMIWLPCEQSISAFFPFFIIKVGKQAFLVRLDGKVFQQLTY